MESEKRSVQKKKFSGQAELLNSYTSVGVYNRKQFLFANINRNSHEEWSQNILKPKQYVTKLNRA